MYGIPGTPTEGTGYQDASNLGFPVSNGNTASSLASSGSNWAWDFIAKFDPNVSKYLDAIKSNYDPDSTYIKQMEQRANNGDIDAIQWMANYQASEKSAQTARDWTAQREDTAYQRLIDDLQKAGISPYILSGGTPAVSSSSGRSYSGTELVSKANNEANNETSQKNAQMQAILKWLGVMAAAVIYAIA